MICFRVILYADDILLLAPSVTAIQNILHVCEKEHGSAPTYLASSFTCVADMPHRRRLRSASTEQLDVPTCRQSTIGGRAFPVAGAKVWNGLPSEVTSASSLSAFKNRLKTYLLRRCYETVWLSITFPFPSHYLPPQNSGPCNSFCCLGHSKNVYDDDDDDDWLDLTINVLRCVRTGATALTTRRFIY